jgi:hypothetical protein
MPLIQKKKPFRRLQSSYECCIVEKDFIDYSMFDVDGLEEVSHRFINSFQTSLKNALISKILITLTNKFRNNGFFSFKVFSL